MTETDNDAKKKGRDNGIVTSSTTV